VVGDHLAQGSDAASAIQNVAASEAFNAIKEQVSHFAENSKILMDALNEIGKVHPFIQSMSFSFLCSLLSSANLFCAVAVSAFKTAIKLELTRRENDQKVLALIVTMLDMMQVMTLSVKPLLSLSYAHLFVASSTWPARATRGRTG